MRHGLARALLALSVLAFFGPMLVRGEVVYPHDNAREVGDIRAEDTGRRSNRRFSDLSSAYVPEIEQHLNGRSSGWISTWNPHVELGRPTWQVFSGTKAYWLTWLASLLTKDALRVYTWLTVAAVLLMAVFAYDLFRVLGLHQTACFAVALALALGIKVTYWHTFVMFAWGLCWTLALLLGLECYARRATLARGLGTAFALHALFLSAYPQQIVWNLWIALGFGVVRVLKHRRGGAARARTVLTLGGWAALGVLSVLPVYLDIAENAGRSSRAEASIEFLSVALRTPDGWRDVLLQLAQLQDAFWIGNPSRWHKPSRYPANGIAPSGTCRNCRCGHSADE
jgi:hypothetical protein